MHGKLNFGSRLRGEICACMRCCGISNVSRIEDIYRETQYRAGEALDQLICCLIAKPPTMEFSSPNCKSTNIPKTTNWRRRYRLEVQTIIALPELISLSSIRQTNEVSTISLYWWTKGINANTYPVSLSQISRCAPMRRIILWNCRTQISLSVCTRQTELWKLHGKIFRDSAATWLHKGIECRETVYIERNAMLAAVLSFFLRIGLRLLWKSKPVLVKKWS